MKSKKRKSQRNSVNGASDQPSLRDNAFIHAAPNKRESGIGSNLIYLGVTWLSVGVLLQVVLAGLSGEEEAAASRTGKEYKGYLIPSDQLQPRWAYPDPVGITDAMRKGFHPVVVWPPRGGRRRGILRFGGGDIEDGKGDTPYRVVDLSTPRQARPGAKAGPALGALVPPDQWDRLRKERKRSRARIPYTVGRFDEDRRAMYTSDLFSGSDGGDSDGGQGNWRTVHIGIDLGGPVGTKVRAFADGKIHSVGFNSAWGDYGNVIVVEHALDNVGERKVWALYGHLDGGSIKSKKAGDPVRRGQVLGRMGDVHENGGWSDPHLHFQLAIKPPVTHDMPGVVTGADRDRALVEYPDPRLVLGDIY